MDVKDVIRSRRIELGLTMKDVASSVGVSEGTVSRWESGDIENMKRSRIYALSKVLDLSPLVIMGMDGEERQNLPSNILLSRKSESYLDLQRFADPSPDITASDALTADQRSLLSAYAAAPEPIRAAVDGLLAPYKQENPAVSENTAE